MRVLSLGAGVQSTAVLMLSLKSKETHVRRLYTRRYPNRRIDRIAYHSFRYWLKHRWR